MKALIVEPSRVYRLLLNELLYGFSISNEEVSTALTELKSNKVDLVIVAMNLVDMTALILAISATTNSSQKIYALQVGANDFIIKAVIQAELIARVKT